MAYSTINKPEDYFNTILYTGTGSSNSITGVGFQPEITWCKNRTVTTYDNRLFDVVRGANKKLVTNESDAESTTTQELMSFDSDGFTLGTEIGINQSGTNYVSWNWLVGGAPSSNTDGSITSSVSVNTTAGLSIVSFTGNLTVGATVGHGLGVAPDCILFKNRTAGTDRWNVYHQGVDATAPEDYRLFLNNTDIRSDTPYLNDTAPSSSVITLGNYSEANGSTAMIAYCFSEVKGFSKFGSYIGNGNADGPFIYTGFKPSWVLVRNATESAMEWVIHDNKRNTFNVTNKELKANSSAAETTSERFDFLSNGFKVRNASSYVNRSGQTIIYMAFAERSLVGTNNIPALAR